MSTLKIIGHRDEAIEEFEQLLEKKNIIINTTASVLHGVITSTDTQESIEKELRKLSLQVQVCNQKIAIAEKKVEIVPHVDDRLRANRLREYMTYIDRLMYVLSVTKYYAKIDKTYLRTEKNKPGVKNKRAVHDRIQSAFLHDSFVLDPNRITDDMLLYVFDNKNIDSLIQDPYCSAIKEKFTNPYFLQYETTNIKTQETKKSATSRIMFFRGSPAIAVFRSHDTHPLVDNPTAHEKRKIQTGMDMYVTDSSYDIIAQQHLSIQHIIQKQGEMTQFTRQLEKILKDITENDENKSQEIQEIISMLAGQVNPLTLMATLYNLSRIPYFNNKIVQGNLLQAAITRLGTRERDLGQYLYYMIPQIQALEDIHDKNIENIQKLHAHTMIAATSNKQRALLRDTREQQEQFNKHDVAKKVTRALKQHPIEQKDHLFGMFYTMHKDIGRLLQLPQSDEKNKILEITIYTHRLIMIAESIAQDLQLGAYDKKYKLHEHFTEIWGTIYETFSKDDIETYFNHFYSIMKTASSHMGKQKDHLVINELRKYKKALEPITQKTT